jgi:hypothetical protein
MNQDEKSELEHALVGLDYPAPREKLIEVARVNNAPHHVLERFRQLPETADFHDEGDLYRVLGINVPGDRSGRGWE